MILPFSTQLNGKPTYFVEKILRGILNEHSHKGLGLAECIYQSGEALKYQNVDDIFTLIENKVKPKLHTIREDKNDRWKAGTKIDFFINCRQPTMFRFAPVLPVVHVQELLMTYYHSDIIQISVDGRELFSYIERAEFAINDGFDSWQDFFNYFYPKIKASPQGVYKPKLIHWTDLKY